MNFFGKGLGFFLLLFFEENDVCYSFLIVKNESGQIIVYPPVYENLHKRHSPSKSGTNRSPTACLVATLIAKLTSRGASLLRPYTPPRHVPRPSSC